MAKVKIELEIDTVKDMEDIKQLVELITLMQQSQNQYNEEYYEDDRD